MADEERRTTRIGRTARQFKLRPSGLVSASPPSGRYRRYCVARSGSALFPSAASDYTLET